MYLLSKDISTEGSKVLEKSNRKIEYTQSGTLVTNGDSEFSVCHYSWEPRGFCETLLSSTKIS